MSKCYYPNGDPAPEGDKPCPNSDACCPDKWSCQSNGLCYLAAENYFGRYTCTDQTWQSSGCPNICTKGNTASGNEAILECSTGNYCCDANRPTPGCCDTTKDRFQLRDIGSGGGQSTSPASSSSAAPRPSSSSSSPTPASMSSSSPAGASSTASPSLANNTPSQRSVAQDRQSSSANSGSAVTAEADSPSVTTLISVITQDIGGSSTFVTSSSITTAVPASSSPDSTPAASKNLGAIIGPVVGGVVGALLLVALAFFLVRRRRKQKGGSSPPPARGSLQPMYGDDNKDLLDSPYTGKSELEGSPNMSVLPAGSPRKTDGYQTPDDVGEGVRTYRGVPMEGEVGIDHSKGELAASPSVARTPQSRRSELPGNDAERDAVGKAEQPAELPAGAAYKAYKPPQASGLGVEL